MTILERFPFFEAATLEDFKTFLIPFFSSHILVYIPLKKGDTIILWQWLLMPRLLLISVKQSCGMNF